MYKKDKDTGEVIGVLADFDLSSLQGHYPSNIERTGTVPFMAIDLLSKKALAGKVEHDYGHEAEAFFWVGVYDTACYDNGHTVHDAVPTQWNYLRDTAMRDKKAGYLLSLDAHIATPSQKDVWRGLSLLRFPLRERHIFERPTEQDPNMLSPPPLFGKTPQPFDPSGPKPDAVQDDFLQVKHHAESHLPSLNRASTSSS
jgi:hypothetical protein